MANSNRVQGSGTGNSRSIISRLKRLREPDNKLNSTATNPSLVELQANHRSQLVIEGQFLKPLFTRLHMVKLPWDSRYKPYVIQAGLYGIHRIGHIPTDHALISALVERWRQETHSFHFPVGEMTITLQDVVVLLGLQVDGEALCLPTDCDWSEVVETLLGKKVDKTTFRPRSKVAINISWLLRHFSVCPPRANRRRVQQYARAYLLILVGSLLFTDHSEDSISAIYLPLFSDFEQAGRYSWASGVLAFLYRELCFSNQAKPQAVWGVNFAAATVVLERLPMGRPRHCRNVPLPQLDCGNLLPRPPLGYGWSGYKELAGHVTCRVQDSYRVEIDALNDGKVNWTPYANKMHLLPPICRESPHLWRTTAPLIHFWIVELYNPGRVARQFGLYQQIPPVLHDTIESLHRMQNGTGQDCLVVHHEYLEDWRNREDKCLFGQRPYDPSEHEEYLSLFSKASLLYLQSPGGVPNTYSSAQHIRQIAANIVEKYKDVADEEMRMFARKMLHCCQAAIKDLLEPVEKKRHLCCL